MIDAYTIGVRLTLSDEVSAGLKTVRRELIALDRAVVGSAAGLRALGRIGAEIGARTRTGVGTRDQGPRRQARPTAPTGGRAVAPAAVRSVAAQPSRRAPTAPSAATMPLASALLLARRILGMGRGITAQPPRPEPTAAASLAAAATGHRAIAMAAPPRPAPSSSPALPPDRRAAARPGTAPSGQMRASPRPARDLVSSASAPAAVRRSGATSSGSAGVPIDSAAARRAIAPRAGTQTRSGKSSAAGEFAALAERVLAGGRPRLAGPVPQRAIHQLVAPPAATPPLRQAGQRSGSGRTDQALLRPVGTGLRSPATARSRAAGDARPNALTGWDRTPRSLLRPSAPPGPLKSRAPSLVRAPGVGRTRRDPAALPSRPLPDTVAASEANSGEIVLDGARFGKLVADRLARHLDRPRAAFTEMDPRATPSWPGATIG
jgi:hypothetical protein